MLLKPFTHVLKENKARESKSYIGDVEDNLDDQKLGRLKVRIPLYDDLDVEDIPYAYPILSVFLGNSPNSIALSVPEIGSQVRVFFPTGDKMAPFYTGAELNSSNKCTFFDEDYPNTYGFKDSKGNFVKINKTTGITIMQHSSTTNVEILQDGSYTITTPDGSSFSSDAAGNFVMDGKTLTINMLNNIILNTGVILATASGFIKLDTPVTTTTGGLGSEIASTASFASGDGQTITVSQGIINNVESS